MYRVHIGRHTFNLTNCRSSEDAVAEAEHQLRLFHPADAEKLEARKIRVVVRKVSLF